MDACVSEGERVSEFGRQNARTRKNARDGIGRPNASHEESESVGETRRRRTQDAERASPPERRDDAARQHSPRRRTTEIATTPHDRTLATRLDRVRRDELELVAPPEEAAAVGRRVAWPLAECAVVAKRVEARPEEVFCLCCVGVVRRRHVVVVPRGRRGGRAGRGVFNCSGRGRVAWLSAVSSAERQRFHLAGDLAPAKQDVNCIASLRDCGGGQVVHRSIDRSTDCAQIDRTNDRSRAPWKWSSSTSESTSTSSASIASASRGPIRRLHLSG